MLGEPKRDNQGGGEFSGCVPLNHAEAVRWLAYYTIPRHEKAVARQFECRSVDYFLPLVRQSRSWKNGVRAQVEQPLFPGYVFARLEPKLYFKALSVPGVLSVVGPTRNPSILDDEEIAVAACWTG